MSISLHHLPTLIFRKRLPVFPRQFIFRIADFTASYHDHHHHHATFSSQSENHRLKGTTHSLWHRRRNYETHFCLTHSCNHFLALSNPVWRNQVGCFSSKAKKSKSKQKAAKRAADTDDETDFEPNDGEDESDFEEDDEETDPTKKDWKDLKMNVPSLRIDVVLSAGLGVSRKKIEDAFLDGKLRHNGKKVMKKSRQVQEGDILDVIKESQFTNKEGNLVTLAMRVEMKKIKEEKTSSDRTPVKLRRWKHLELPREK